MNIDTNITRKLRDMNPDSIVTISINGEPLEGARAEDFLSEFDNSVVAARKQGARHMLDKMGDVLYQVAAEGSDGTPEEQARQKMMEQVAYVQLSEAKRALDDGLVDFTHVEV